MKRVSIKESNFGYESNANRYPHYKFYLNGKKYVDGVVTADEERGYIEVYDKDKNGDIVIEDFKVKTKIIYGKVEIKFDWIGFFMQEIKYKLIRCRMKSHKVKLKLIKKEKL